MVKKTNNKRNVIELLCDGKVISDPLAIANRFNSHFSIVGKRVLSEIAKVDKNLLEYVKHMENNLILDVQVGNG